MMEALALGFITAMYVICWFIVDNLEKIEKRTTLLEIAMKRKIKDGGAEQMEDDEDELAIMGGWGQVEAERDYEDPTPSPPMDDEGDPPDPSRPPP